MDKHSIIKLTELQTLYYCKRIVTVVLIAEELAKSVPDFENASIEMAKVELRNARKDVEEFLLKNPLIKSFALQWNVI